MARKKVIIAGAAGRDFHNFNTYFRDNAGYEVVAFTAAQIPDIAGRKYPPSLAGKLYPQGIPIFEEARMAELIEKHDVDEVVFAYSDVPYARVMSMSALVNAKGADFVLMGHKTTMLKSTKPVISVCAVRTGCGKSQTTRYIYDILRKLGKRVVAIRHPMPYGDLEAQKVQRFAKIEDLERHQCTIEEMEEHEPHIDAGNISYGGVDYEAILRTAEERDNPDVILFDGGNNDMPFYQADLKVVVVDPLRAGHEVGYYPGEANLRMADVVVINKMDSASPQQLKIVRDNIRRLAPDAVVVEADSRVDPRRRHQGEAGPGHRGRPHLDPRRDAVRRGHGRRQAVRRRRNRRSPPPCRRQDRRNLPKISQHRPRHPPRDGLFRPAEAAICRRRSTPSMRTSILSGTPIDLTRIVSVNKPVVRVRYELKPRNGSLGLLEKAIAELLAGNRSYQSH